MLKDLQLMLGVLQPIAMPPQQISALSLQQHTAVALQPMTLSQQPTAMDLQPMITLLHKVKDLLRIVLTLKPSARAQLPIVMDLNQSTSWLQPTGWDLNPTVLGKAKSTSTFETVFQNKNV